MKRLLRLFLFLIIIPLIISGITNRCIYPFDPVIDKYENLLVVDGLLTNIPGECFVRLSRTYRYGEKSDSVEKGAVVSVVDDLGNETLLKDNGGGQYLPEDTLFAGEPGRKYSIHVETSKGEICESSPEEMKEPVDIENIYYEVKDKGNGIMGLQVLLDTRDPLKRSVYYAWNYDETWEFAVPYLPRSEYLPESKVCYKNVASKKIAIESTRNYTDDRVIGFPLYFVDNTTNRLEIKYSVLVRQYVLTEKTYEYFRNLSEINESTGTLFDRTPVILVGNLVNRLNPDQPVLGNFQVSGASEKRIFVKREDLPPEMYITTEYEFCKADLLSNRKDRIKLDSLFRTGWTVMDTIYDTAESDTLIGVVISRACFDCTLKGDINKPLWWDDK